MFIYSMHANTIKFFAVICLALTALIALITFAPTYADGSTPAGTQVTEKQVMIPSEFDKIFLEYNEIQRRQGLDLSAFKKKSVMRYTYSVKNYPGYEGEVHVNLLVYKNTVIGGDVCSADVNGFVHGFEKSQ